jgi:hypothetical protein
MYFGASSSASSGNEQQRKPKFFVAGVTVFENE